MAGKSRWSEVTMAPADPILGVAVAYNADPSPKKVNLGIGAYRDSEGKPLVLQCVREAEKRIANDEALNKEYLPVQGFDRFLKITPQIIFGKDSPAVVEGRVAVCQSLSGTGALRIAAEFIAMYNPGTMVYISNPSWGNHHTIFKKAGLKYLNKTMGLDFDGMVADLSAAPRGSTFVLHTVAHNPTGVDPSQDQWKKLADVCQEAIFDTAYQGYASGDLERDAWAVRYFANTRGLELMVTQSYSKNFGLYGERIGALNVAVKSKDTAAKISSQLKGIVRPMYSNPQLHGARLVTWVMEDPALKALWEKELKEMSDRITEMRSSLVAALVEINCPPPNANFRNWNHITSQIGMFAFTGLSEKHCSLLTGKHHIYCTKNGRFSMAGVNPSNVKYIAAAMKDAINSCSKL
ncbi:hypothetical protein GUITHDRAFT_158574 [Guillardia theta CCMP2712]|uniref:Aspartate aminotransferase n=1 Tax=Guillardia theta (strain CCMP2712) TaxID=905079 RepID=L1INW1_GUITC|nr:hypothetical protein GUITHDRAFT_158574 [Guillardia theta CCMP2712]EKX37574.1 hypothetical protein GUITHDRAFT_158574 [Guillardia theta CCMP2712]|eukprot:XP_005824554.1 hypothetical protein GUITHDRAFT_158574 [Guillardia theta CCMP2712]